jgi:hypothetical protein
MSQGIKKVQFQWHEPAKKPSSLSLADPDTIKATLHKVVFQKPWQLDADTTYYY